MATAASTAARGTAAAVTSPADPSPVAAAAAAAASTSNGTVDPSAVSSARSGSDPGSRAASLAGGVSVSASVGHDHWASDVLSAVQANNENGSDAADHEKQPQLDSVSVEDSEEASAASSASAAVESSTPVSQLVLEKKRKFHSGRMLELKNLPDGCTEQVRPELLAAGGGGGFRPLFRLRQQLRVAIKTIHDQEDWEMWPFAASVTAAAAVLRLR